MQRSEYFEGGGSAPVEGDRTIWVRSIPRGAQLRSAVLTFTPVAAAGTPLFEERIVFSGATGTLGATQSTETAAVPHWTELDLHQRRTVTRIAGTALTGAQLQVDLGGLYVQLNKFGAPKGPGDDPFLLPADGAVPGLTANKFKLTDNVSPLLVNTVTLRSTPSNLVVRAGSQPAFYSRPGELVAPVSTPDVAIALQAALAGAAVDGGFYRLPVVVHSDTLCRLDVLLDVEFTVEAPALPGGLSETTLTYDFAGAPATPAVTLAVPAGAHLVPTAARARAVGAFQATRVGYGPVGPVTPSASLALAASRSLAVPITVPSDLDATAVDLLLAATTPTARLQLNLVADTDGKPWDQPLLDRPVELGVERGDDPAPRWVSAALPAPFTFRAATRYWLTLQVEAGEASWSVVGATATPATQQTLDGGLSWRQAGATAADALLRLRVEPAEFTMPLQLQVGASTRVSLDRFAPLGRVEIDLNSADVVDGINSAVTAAAAAACPTGEHLRNGDFSVWTRTADLPTGSTALDAGFRVRRIAVARDCTAFVAGGADAGGVDFGPVLTQLAAVDVFGDRVLPSSTPLAAGHVLSGLASDPGGRYCYALLDGASVFTLDKQTGRTMTTPLAHSGAVAAVAAANGTTLYVAAAIPPNGQAVNVVVAIPADAARSAGPAVWGAEIALDRPPFDVVATPDGATLWVLVDDDGLAALVRIDTARAAVVGRPIDLAAGPARCAVSAGGSALAVVHPGSGMLTVVDPVAGATHQVDLAVANDDPQPTAAAVSADGRYAFVALGNRAAVAVVDLAARRVLRRVPVGTGPADCAITPDGERVYVADDAFTELTIGALLPGDWVVTAGTVRPWCVPPGGRVAVVGDVPHDVQGAPPTATAAIAQVVPVSAACRYELSFAGLASADGATAELHWRGAGCADTRVDTVPITPDRPRISREAAPALGLLPHRILASAPADAGQVEVRVQAPAGVAAVVDRISLHATASVLPNGDLALSGDVLDGWLVTPPSPAGFTATTDGDELVLANASAATVTVAQSASVESGRTYQLSVDASAPAGTPSVELGWSAGTPVSVPVAAGASRPLLHSAVAPAGAASVEVRLVLPAGAGLRVRRVSLDTVSTTAVPVTFIAESPGELTLIDWQVAYDADETPRVPPLPAGGLCRPGRPEQVPGEASEDCCYCATCQGEHDMADPRPTATPAGTPGTVFTCTNCGSGVTLPGVIVGPRPASGPVVVTVPPGTDVGPILRPVGPARRPVPLDAVIGIGRATARRLNAIGIVDLVDLAAAPLARVSALKGVTDAAARSWIEQARALVSVDGGD